MFSTGPLIPNNTRTTEMFTTMNMNFVMSLSMLDKTNMLPLNVTITTINIKTLCIFIPFISTMRVMCY